MSLYSLRDKINKKDIFCQYKNKHLPIGFLDDVLAKRVAQRISYTPQKLNCRLKTREMHSIFHEENMFDEITNDMIRGLSRDIDASLLFDREIDFNKNENPWEVLEIDENEFYSFPFRENCSFDGIVICHDIEPISQTNFFVSYDSYNNFIKKTISLKSVVILFDTLSIGQLKNLLKK